MKNIYRKQALKHNELEKIRHIRGRSILLFITDRCPVGCAHCSVDSRRDSPTISDFNLFSDIVDWICSQQDIEVVAFLGENLFVERRGLMLASSQFSDASKRLVIFTSGVWATGAKTPSWINDVLSRCSCVYLSTDFFHTKTVDSDNFIRAARTIAEAGVWIVVQTLHSAHTLEQVKKMLRTGFGENWDEFAEINAIKPLTNGRGATIFKPTSHSLGHTFVLVH